MVHGVGFNIVFTPRTVEDVDDSILNGLTLPEDDSDGLVYGNIVSVGSEALNFEPKLAIGDLIIVHSAAVHAISVEGVAYYVTECGGILCRIADEPEATPATE